MFRANQEARRKLRHPYTSRIDFVLFEERRVYPSSSSLNMLLGVCSAVAVTLGGRLEKRTSKGGVIREQHSIRLIFVDAWSGVRKSSFTGSLMLPRSRLVRLWYSFSFYGSVAEYSISIESNQSQESSLGGRLESILFLFRADIFLWLRELG